MTETVIFEREGPIGRLRLNRPAKLNAQTPQMWAELRELGRTLRDEPDLRCLVVCGEGRAFSSGIDLAEIMGQDGLGAAAHVKPGAGVDRLVAMIRQGQEAFSWLVDAPFASIAAVRGYALGAGLQLALACDLRIAARTTQLGALEFRYGLLPDLGGTAWLPRLVGPARAKELVFTAARIDAEEALRIGLVNAIADPVRDKALETAHELAGKSRLALSLAKELCNLALGGDHVAGLESEVAGFGALFASQDAKEGLAAFVEKRPPNFVGR